MEPSARVSEERHPNNLVAMLLALVPGLSQVYLEHVLLGAIFFSAFLTALNCLFLASNLQSATNTQLLGQISLLSLIVIWIGSAWHAYALSYGTDRSGLARDRGQLLRLALLDYLRNDLEPAAVKLERAIELDVDWQDPDPLFHLGVVLLRLAEERALDQDTEGSRVARRRSQWAFRTCLGRDRFGKWRREIRRETKRMRTLLRSTGRATSERLGAADDTTIASFPELGESTSIPRPPLGPDSSRYPRITPRPFSRRVLKERLEASGLEDDTVAALPPEDESSESEAARAARETEETRVLPPREESTPEPAESEGDAPASPREGSDEPDPEPRPEEPAPQTKTKTKTKTKTEEAEPKEEASKEDESKSVGPEDSGSSDEGDLAATQPAQRLLPGEEEGSFAGSPEAPPESEEEALVTEGGMPATRLDVRPQDLIPDLLPATRQRSREGSSDSEGLTPYPATRTASRIGGEDEGAVAGIPPTRHVSRAALGSLAKRRPPIEEALAEAGKEGEGSPGAPEEATTEGDAPKEDAVKADAPEEDAVKEAPEKEDAEGSATEGSGTAGDAAGEDAPPGAASQSLGEVADAGDLEPAEEAAQGEAKRAESEAGEVDTPPTSANAEPGTAESDEGASLSDAGSLDTGSLDAGPPDAGGMHPRPTEVEPGPEADAGLRAGESAEALEGPASSDLASSPLEESSADTSPGRVAPGTELASSAIEEGIPPTRSFVIGGHEAPAGFDEISVKQLRADESGEGPMLEDEVLEDEVLEDDVLEDGAAVLEGAGLEDDLPEDVPEDGGLEDGVPQDGVPQEGADPAGSAEAGPEDAEHESPRGGGGAPPSDAGGSQAEEAAEAADSSASHEARGSDGNSA